MKDILQWIPNFFKGMLEVMKEAQKMAGGGVKGQVVFWIGFLIFVAIFVIIALWATKPAYDNFTEVLSHFSINVKQVEISIPSSLWINLLLTLLIAIIEFVILIGAGAIIGAFLGTLTSAILSPNTTQRIDNVFHGLTPILEKMEDKTLLEDTYSAYDKWNSSRMTKTTRWIDRVIRIQKKVKQSDAKTSVNQLIQRK